MKTKAKQPVDGRWATELVRERMKESQVITHLGFDVEKVEKGRAVLLMVLPHVQQKNGAPLLHFLHIEAEMRAYLTFFHALAHPFGAPAPVHRLSCPAS